MENMNFEGMEELMKNGSSMMPDFNLPWEYEEDDEKILGEYAKSNRMTSGKRKANKGPMSQYQVYGIQMAQTAEKKDQAEFDTLIKLPNPDSENEQGFFFSCLVAFAANPNVELLYLQKVADKLKAQRYHEWVAHLDMDPKKIALDKQNTIAFEFLQKTYPQ